MLFKIHKRKKKNRLNKHGNQVNGLYFGNNDNLDKDININISTLKNLTGKSDDIIFRELTIAFKKQTKAFVCFMDGLADNRKIEINIIKPLVFDILTIEDCTDENEDLLSFIKKRIFCTSRITETKSIDDVVKYIFSGSTILLIDGYSTAIISEIKKSEGRNIEEPDTEATIRGPRDGFTENLSINISLIRKRIKNPALIFEPLNLGNKTHTDIKIGYIKGIANTEIIEEVKKRLNKIDIDAVLESGYIEQLIEDRPFSVVATVGNSEKPDRIAAKLLEGRVAIFCDGTPFVLTVPYLFIETLHASEDYYSRPFLTTMIRLIRLLAYGITLAAPSLYVSLVTFHQEMIPTELLIRTAGAREGIPFPAFIEALGMGVVFELLRESGVRMPRPIGQAVSIVGALVLGEAAVQAGIVSPIMVIIVAITAIASFITPALTDSTFFFRTFILILSGFLGLYGFIIAFMVILAHLCSLNSVGVPYLLPFSPTNLYGLKDSLIRAPIWLLNTKPELLMQNTSNQKNNDKNLDKYKGDR